MKKTVVHLVYSLGYGGLEQVIVNLINNSSDYDINHVIITLVNNHDLFSQLESDVLIYCLHKESGNDIKSYLRLYKLLKDIKPDVINTYNFGTIEYHIVSALVKIPIKIHSDHGFGGDNSSGKSIKRQLIRKAISFLLNKYIVVSPDLECWVLNTLKVNRFKVELIYNGVNTHKYLPSDDKYPSFTICNVGRVDPIKNQMLLIKAYKKLYDSNLLFKDSQLLIVGDGPIFLDIEQEIEKLDLGSNIKLLGYRDDISNILSKSHLFVLSSNYEAMPMTVLEAMSCGLPIICTDVGGASNIVSDDVGWLVHKDNVEQLSSAIENAFFNREILKNYSNNRNIVKENYSIERMVAKYMQVYGIV